MGKTKTVLMGIAASLMLAAQSGPATAVAYDIGWNSMLFDYSMTGRFSFDDSLIGTGAIDETEIDSLRIEVFQGTMSLGTWDLGTDGVFGEFNFNFDTTSETFVVGGFSDGPAGQQWNTGADLACPASGVGFVSGLLIQAVCVDGELIDFAQSVNLLPVLFSTLTASRVVPEPATLALFGLGLASLAVARRRNAPHRRV